MPVATRKTTGTTTKSTGSKIQTPSGEKTASEIQAMAMRQEQSESNKQAIFKYVADTLQLASTTTGETRTFQTFSKDRLRQFLRNPKQNEDNIRQLSDFLYRACFAYRRIIQYMATMIDLNAVSVIPTSYDLVKNNNDKKILKSYQTTAKKIQQMGLERAMFPMILLAWKFGVSYGYIYDDGNTFFIHPLPNQYCRISSNDGGSFRFMFDFSYFRGKEEYELSWWDKEFTKRYNKFLNDPSLRWQELDFNRQICLKIDVDDWTMCLPPFLGLFDALISNTDLQSLQDVKDNLSIYKLLVARLKPLSGTNLVDDFEVDPATAFKYIERAIGYLPEEVAMILSPLPIEPIEFDKDSTAESDMIANSNKNLFKASGGAQVLYNDNGGVTATNAQIISDSRIALSSLLPQIQSFVNNYLELNGFRDHCLVKYLEVTPYTREQKKKELLNSGQYGIPTRLAIAALDGFTPMEALSLLYLENDCLGLVDRMIPLSSSWTKSSSDGNGQVSQDGSEGAPTKDDGDLSDAGAETRDNKT